MHKKIRLTPPSIIKGKIDLPTSKSITNRALVMASLATGQSEIIEPLYSDDTKVMIEALQNIGVKIEKKKDRIIVYGNGGKFTQATEPILLGNAGTATRFLTAISCLIEGENIITGDSRMQERPINELTDALKFFEIDIKCSDTGCPPIKVKKSDFQGGYYEISGEVSSQYISALLLIAPFAKKETTLKLENTVSKPYIDITIKLLKQFGINIINDNFHTLTIPCNQSYKNTTIHIEKDASSATYWCALAGIGEGEITLAGLSRKYIQGDIRFLDLARKMGCDISETIEGIKIKGKKLIGLNEIDMSDIPDTVMTIAMMATQAQGYTHIKNVKNLRVKECDRLKALSTELTKCGVKVEEYDDGIKIQGKTHIQNTTIKTYNDHRIAMSFALLSVLNQEIIIENPDCVKKSYPNYWKDLESIGFKIEEV